MVGKDADLYRVAQAGTVCLLEGDITGRRHRHTFQHPASVSNACVGHMLKELTGGLRIWRKTLVESRNVSSQCSHAEEREGKARINGARRLLHLPNTSVRPQIPGLVLY